MNRTSLSLSPVSRLYRFFRSVKLAVVLILVIVALSITATLIPQGQPAAFYQATYGPATSALITALGMDELFSSPLFLTPVALFLINLAVCTAHRLLQRARAGAAHRHGPDLIHVGLLILIAGGVITATLRQEKQFFMTEGDSVEIAGRYRLTLERFRFLTYSDGRPRDWISTLRIETTATGPDRTAEVQVNSPLHLGNIKIYQTSYDKEITAHLRDRDGKIHVISRGQGFHDGELTVAFADVREDSGDGTAGNAGHASTRAVFQRWQGERQIPSLLVGPGETVGDYTLVSASARLSTGLTAVRDPGFVPVLIGLIMSGTGLALTFAQKNRKKPRKGEVDA